MLLGALLVEVGAGVGEGVGVEVGAGEGVEPPPPPPPQAATINAIRLADANFGFLNFKLLIFLDIQTDLMLFKCLGLQQKRGRI